MRIFQANCCAISDDHVTPMLLVTWGCCSRRSTRTLPSDEAAARSEQHMRRGRAPAREEARGPIKRPKETHTPPTGSTPARQQASSRYFSSSARVPERQSALLLRLFSTMRSALLALAITTTSGLAPPKDYHVSRPRENAFFLGAAAFCQNPNATGCLSTLAPYRIVAVVRGVEPRAPVAVVVNAERARLRGHRGARKKSHPRGRRREPCRSRPRPRPRSRSNSPCRTAGRPRRPAFWGEAPPPPPPSRGMYKSMLSILAMESGI